MIHRIRDRAAFERLASHGSRIRRPALWCTWCPDPRSNVTCVAYAFGRAYGPAVARNRIRRRLRSILREIDLRSPLPPGLMLIGGRSQAGELTFDELTAEMQALTTEVRRRSGSET